MSDEEIKWPSERVVHGGLFHPHKVQYSKETNDLLNLLMKESHLSMMIRKKVNYHLRNGDPLPLPVIKKPEQMQDEDSKIALQIMCNARNARRKSLETIQASGAYDAVRYRPKPDLREPTNIAKIKLQESMSGLKIPLTDLKGKRKPVLKIPNRNSDPTAQIDEILEEINERTEWLIEMEELGEGKKYKDLIHGQIAEKLRKIRQLEKKIDEIEKFKQDQKLIQLLENE